MTPLPLLVVTPLPLLAVTWRRTGDAVAVTGMQVLSLAFRHEGGAGCLTCAVPFFMLGRAFMVVLSKFSLMFGYKGNGGSGGSGGARLEEVSQ